jgi:hypothetical protein
MKWLKALFGSNPLKDAADIVDRFVDTKDDKREFFKEVFKMQSDDRNSGRALYAKDSIIQKIYALVFLLSYVALTGYFVHWAVNHTQSELTDFQISFISTIWGAMSSKVSTVTDFFFGASDDTKDRNHDNLIGKK